MYTFLTLPALIEESTVIPVLFQSEPPDAPKDNIIYISFHYNNMAYMDSLVSLQ